MKEMKVRVCGGWTSYTYNKTSKLLAIDLSGAGRGLTGTDSADDLTSLQYKPIWNCHSESHLYNEYILQKRK
jgi:hypothetical protein